jgi:hypothetical protein
MALSLILVKKFLKKKVPSKSYAWKYENFLKKSEQISPFSALNSMKTHFEFA